jgi:NADPH:quinone reductase-like Zn-dependent oxidoreductase
VLKVEDLPLDKPGESEIRLKVKAVGLNRVEVMFRHTENRSLIAPLR